MTYNCYIKFYVDKFKDNCIDFHNMNHFLIIIYFK